MTRSPSHHRPDPRWVRILPILLVIATPAMAAAGDGAIGELPCVGEVGLEQPPVAPGDLGMASEIDNCELINAELADDIPGLGARLTGLGWWGATSAAFDPEDPIGFVVRLYHDDSAGHPGELFHEVEITSYEIGRGDPNAYCAFLDDPVMLPADVTYHLSIRAVMCAPPVWGWVRGTGNQVPVHWRTGYFGYPEWTQGVFGDGRDAAVVLYVEDESTPIRSVTFGGIKARYR